MTALPRPVSPAYLRDTRTATYAVLACAPLWALYEAAMMATAAVAPTGVRIGAEIWLKQAAAYVGVSGIWAFGLLAAVVASVVVWRERRRRRVVIRPRWIGLLVGEGLLYAALVVAVLPVLVGRMFALAPTAPLDGIATPVMLALSLGAGLYEEIVFRVLLVGGLAWGLQRVGVRQRVAYVTAALAGALLFSAVHYVGPFADALTLPSFTFRFLFGLAMNVLLLLRGLGVAAWTHAWYDILVTLLR